VILVLAGCTSIPEKPITQTVNVMVPVPIKCHITLPSIPRWELSRIALDASLFDLSRAAVIELRQHYAYELELRAAITSCE